MLDQHGPILVVVLESYTTYSSGAVQVRSEGRQRSYYEVCCHYAKQYKCCVQEAVHAVRDAT